MQIACISGLFNILNGFLIVYASSPIRTPPLIQVSPYQKACSPCCLLLCTLHLASSASEQAILQNAAVLFSIPCSKLILNDNKKYVSLQPLIACALVVASIIVSVLPLIITGQVRRCIGILCHLVEACTRQMPLQADDGFDSASAFGWIAGAQMHVLRVPSSVMTDSTRHCSLFYGPAARRCL